ncbi:MAG: GAF domain-containing protein, partial [Gammaproteobacteria bacterium]|nr:GAF domain-containing protein [Gammaproteobacteria bacterium]
IETMHGNGLTPKTPLDHRMMASLLDSQTMLNKITIRKKIWISFGILVVLLVAVGISAFTSLKANKEKLSTLVNDVQPAMEQSLNLVDHLDRVSASLGFYLLSKELIHKNDYIYNLNKITQSVQLLSSMRVVQDDAATLKMVDEVQQGIIKLQSYKEQMLVFASDDAKNTPALGYAGREVNPRAQTMLQSLQEMLLAEGGESANETRRQFLLDIFSLRTNVASALNELRIFLAFRADANKENFRSYMDLIKRDVDKLNGPSKSLLGFEQEESFANFNIAFRDWGPAAEEVMRIHGAEDWRQDAYVIRKEISPLVLQIQERLTALVKTQHDFSVESSAELTTQVSRTQYIVAGLIMLGMICAVMVGLFLTRTIITPIDALKNSAIQLAHGDLNQAIDTQRKDELGSLAQSFADMRDAIKKKINDLHVLNATGQIMASMHDPMKVLEHALKTMRDHCDVEWGSVYLYNQENGLLEVKAYSPARDASVIHNARTFKIGEGVAGGAAQEKRIIYIPDTTKDQQFAAEPGDDASSRAIICVPMIDNNEIFGVMNFCGDVGEVKFVDTDREFAETIARTAVVSFKNINMLNVIAEQNRTLEHKVETRTSELRQKTNDINNMLQNMHQGIFTILPGRTIHPEYSAYLESIVEDTKVANADIMDLLFKDTNLGSNGISQISAALDAILGEDAMMFDFNKHCLVHEFTRTMPDGRSKILELDWDPLIGENDVIEKLMVTVRDVTELRSLQAEAEKQKAELQIIGQILSVGQEKFLGFIKDATRFLDENEKLIKETAAASPDVVATLFRNMHTIKGNARTYGFMGVTDVAHEAETTYSVLRSKPDAFWDKEKMLTELARTRERIENYATIQKDKLANTSSDGVYVDLLLIDKLRDVLEEVNEHDVDALRSAVRTVKSISGAIGTESIPSLLDAITRSLPELAQRLGKVAPKIVINDNGIRLAVEVAQVMKNVFTHGFRNAMDHGIETAEERTVRGKSEQGTITLDVYEEGSHVVLAMSDDGRGLALRKLKDKATAQGIVYSNEELTDLELADLIFQSGLSTAEHVSDISGRGVGMDAIRKFVEKLGGKVELRFTHPSMNDAGYRPFESRILLPAVCAVKVV